VREFVVQAAPIVLAGSLVLGILYETGAIRLATRPLAPVVEGWLGLPAVAGLTLVFAVLRKELALQLLLALAVVEYGRGAGSLLAFMTPAQIFTYALVNTIYIPCAATMAILGKALGWRRAAAISAGTVALAVAAGGVAARVLALLAR
jgi:ferrous iron transport protein B